MRLLFAAVAAMFLPAGAALAQTTYWLPTVQNTPTETILTYDVMAPDYFVPWLLQTTPAGGGATETRAVDGRNHPFFKQFFSWDTGGSSPAKTGQIRLDNVAEPNRYRSSDWKHEPRLQQDAALIAALDSAVPPSQAEAVWKSVDLLALRSEGTQAPNLVLRVPVPEGDQIKARMRQIAKGTVPGQFFPNEVQRPSDLDAMRREMLAWGNLGRRDPNFRAANSFARDLSADQVPTGPNTFEKVYRNNPQPPYFDDLVLHPALNEACQWMAEYYALTNGNASQPKDKKHDAPGARYEGADMSTFGARLAHFAPQVGSAGEGLGGGGPADAYPEGWMRSETHYRPWFNIDHDVKSMGLGAAKTANGWFFCKIGGLEAPSGGPSQPAASNGQPAPSVDPFVSLGAPPTAPAADPFASLGAPAPARLAAPGASAVPTPTTLPLAPSQALEQGVRYPSGDGAHYMVMQPDNNLVVYRAADDGFVWGLNERPGIDYRQAASARMSPEGNFEVLDAAGTPIWSIPGGLGATLDLTASGAPHVSLAGAADNFALPLELGQALAQGERYPSLDGRFYLEHQPDNNLVVRRTADDGFAWGLNEQPGVDYRQAAAARMTPGGAFVVLDGGGQIIWSLDGGGGGHLTLSPEGRPTIGQP